GKVTLGRDPLVRTAAGKMVSSSAIRPSMAPRVADFRRRNRDAFYGDCQSGGGACDQAALMHQAPSYATGWGLVHVLQDAHRPAFAAFLNALAQGAKVDEAWDRTLGVVSDEALDAELRAFLGRRETAVLRAPYEPRAGQAGAPRPLRDAEVH